MFVESGVLGQQLSSDFLEASVLTCVHKAQAGPAARESWRAVMGGKRGADAQ